MSDDLGDLDVRKTQQQQQRMVKNVKISTSIPFQQWHEQTDREFF